MVKSVQNTIDSKGIRETMSGAFRQRLTMVKLIALLKRKPGLSREAFKLPWLEEHTRLSSQLPGCVEYLGLREAVRRAGAIATRSVLKPGTQTSFPAREEVADLL
jgi:sugar/nucleoside kinase (ribokinase family)